MKSLIIKILHSILGYDRYLYVFSICKITTLIFFRKKWDYLYFVRKLMPDSNVVVIGASTGITTIPLAKKCKKAKVFAYEPIKSNYNTIIKLLNFYKLKNCYAFKLAIGEKTQYKNVMLQPIVRGVRKQGMAHLDQDDIDKYDNYIKEDVEISTIDERQELKGIKIDAIKVVAENSEFEIFGGAKDTIKKNKPFIYCELWDNEKRDRVIERIESYGYACFYMSKRKLIPIEKSKYRSRNIFFIPTHE